MSYLQINLGALQRELGEMVRVPPETFSASQANPSHSSHSRKTRRENSIVRGLRISSLGDAEYRKIVNTLDS